jgi:hypothetical protein
VLRYDDTGQVLLALLRTGDQVTRRVAEAVRDAQV